MAHFYSILFFSAGLLFFIAGLWIFLEKLRRFRQCSTIQNGLPVRIMVCDADGNVLYFHREHGLKTPLLAEEYKTIDDMPWVDRPRLIPRIHAVLQGGEAEIFHYNFFGEKRSVIITQLAESTFGRPAVTIVSCDSHLLQEAQKAAADTAHRFEATLQSLLEAVIVTDVDGKITMLNQTAATLTGYSPIQAQGQPIDSIFRIQDYRTGYPVPSPVAEALTTHKAIALENGSLSLLQRGGKSLRIAARASEIKDEQHKAQGAVLTFRDITAEYDQRDELHLRQELMRGLCEKMRVCFFRFDLDTQASVPLVEGMHFRPDVDNQQIPLNQWLSPDDADEVISALEAIRTGSRLQLNRRIKTLFRDEIRHYLLFASRLSNEIIGMPGNQLYGVLIDVTNETVENDRQMEKLALMRTILDHIPFPIFTKDPDNHFRYTNCNRFFAEQFNRSKNDIVGKTDFQLMSDPADADALQKNDVELIVKGAGYATFEEKYRLPNGSYMHCRSQKQLLQLPDGRKLLLGINIDLSKAEQALLAAEDQIHLLQAVIDQLPAAVFVKDADNEFRFLLWNRRYVECTGVSAAQAIGKNNEELGMPASLAREYDAVDQAVLAGTPYRARKKFTLHSGQQIECDIQKESLPLKGKNLILGVSLDITTQQQVESERDSVINRLEALAADATLVNRCLETLLCDESYDITFSKILELIGTQLKSGCLISMRYIADSKEPYFRRQQSWENPNNHHGLTELDYLPERTYPAVYAALKNGEIIHTHLIPHPGETQWEWQLQARGYLARANQLELLIIPIFLHRKFWGYIGTEHAISSLQFGESETRMLEAGAHVIEMLLQREEHHATQHHTEQEMQMVLNMLQIPVLLFDRDEMVLEANPAAAKTFNYSLPELIRKSAGTLYGTSENLIGRTIAENKPQSGQYQLNDQLYQVKCIPITENGQIVKVLQTLIDLTELKVSTALWETNSEKSSNESTHEQTVL